jgi:non-haem Fe2+, alpha-ketoglutarate-dependent halogenase
MTTATATAAATSVAVPAAGSAPLRMIPAGVNPFGPEAAEYDRQRIARFHPADPTKARTLSHNQVERFNAEGYLSPLDVFTPREADANRRNFDTLLSQFLAAGHDSYAINGYHGHCQTLWDIAMDRRILDIIEDLIGPDFVMWGSHFFCKMPGDGKAVSWHQDGTYWPFTPTKTVTVWLAFDDSDAGNGGMRVVPRSHLHGDIPWRPSRPEEGNALFRSVDAVEQFGDAPQQINLASGQISLHSDLLLHGSKPNTSVDRRRCGLTLRYAPMDVRSYARWNNQAIWCRGTDPSGHWSNQPRPTGNDPLAKVEIRGSN